MIKSVENKVKRTLLQDIKLAIKVGTIASILIAPINTNVGGYITSNNTINNGQTEESKTFRAELIKDLYQERGPISKICNYGDFLAAERYIKSK
ncbi:hypothetical protein HOD29_01700 [archaeon]|jgi:hypothetical protein|nr:hypothetical protein [archaeon]